jgi:hypothetical protein
MCEPYLMLLVDEEASPRPRPRWPQRRARRRAFRALGSVNQASGAPYEPSRAACTPSSPASDMARIS